MLGLAMLACAAVALWLSLARPGERGLEDSVIRLGDSQRQEDEALDRQRRVAETVAILECRRRYSADECPDLNEYRPTVRRSDAPAECTKVVVAGGQRRNQSCGTR